MSGSYIIIQARAEPQKIGSAQVTHDISDIGGRI